VPVDPTALTQAPPTEPPSRQVIGERYEILGLLGSGGMGNVYKARDLELDELCALKVLRPELSGAPGVIERFRREVKLARRVTHPNVARVFDIGERGGEKILTMELIDGEALSALLAREGRLPVERIVALGAALCAGLGAAHAAGVIHRDLKPDNVMLEKGGRVVITDFGIARAAAAADALATAALVGTPAYMAPEQIEGKSAIDERTDVYALGAMLFELCTGERPFQGETVFAVAAARLLQPPPDPRGLRPDLPTALAALVQRCMARRPEDRFASAAAVASELAALTLPPPEAPEAPAEALPSPALPSPDPRAPAGVKRVAVLPFRNSGPPEHDYLADGLTEDVIDALSMAPGLRVASRGMVMRYKGSDRDPREVGRELGVQAVVDGTVRRTGGGVRIAARLASVADGVQLWARRFDRPDAELLDVSDDAARAIAEALAVELGAPGRAAGKGAEQSADAEAMDLYLQARAAYHRFFSDLGGAASLPLFERALARAPRDPRILAGYAMARARVLNDEGTVERSAVEAAARAVELAPGSSHAHRAVAEVTFRSGDETAAVRSLRTALRLAPANAEAHELLGRILSETTLLLDARRHLRTALTLEPEITTARLALSRTHELLGEHDEADHLFDARFEETLPVRARVLLWRRDARRAAEILPRVPPTSPANRVARGMLEILSGVTPSYALALEFGLRATLGFRVRTFFLQMEAEIAVLLGDPARALTAITRATSQALFDVAWMDRCPLLAELRADPAFQAARVEVAARAAAVEQAYRAPPDGAR
jgi:eukaryotic-like serine/threonine-protein kinase